MEEERNTLLDHLTERIRRFLAVLVSVLLLLSIIVLVLVGIQSLTAIAAAFTVFALAVVFVLGLLGVSRAFCCYACDGPVRRSLWFTIPSDASLVANSMPGSTRESVLEIPYPDSTELPSWINAHELLQPPDYFTATTQGHQGEGGVYPDQEMPPPSYKFLSEAGLIPEFYDEQMESQPESSNQTTPESTGTRGVGEQRTSLAIIVEDDKPPK